MESSGHTKGPNSSPLLAARHPQSQREVRAVIYIYVSKWRRRPFFRKPEACSSLDVIFRRQALQARGVREPKRAAQPWAARSHRLRRASLGAPLSDTDLEDGAQKIVQVISLRSLMQKPFWWFTSARVLPCPFSR